MNKPVLYYSIPVRLEFPVVEKLDAIAARQFNSRSGIIRMAIDMLIRSMPPEESETAAQPSTEAQAA